LLAEGKVLQSQIPAGAEQGAQKPEEGDEHKEHCWILPRIVLHTRDGYNSGEAQERRITEPLGGKTMGTPISGTVSTRLQRIADLAREAPGRAFLSLSHHIDLKFLYEAFRRTRKDGATGVDGQTGKDYEERLEQNLRSLLDRFKSGTYQAPPVRRTYVPKGDGSKTRPIGIPDLRGQGTPACGRDGAGSRVRAGLSVVCSHGYRHQPPTKLP
jgi:hypothetical protein